MYDSTTIANNVSRWTGLGVQLPEELSNAITVFESLTYTEMGYQPVFDITEVTPANAEERIREFAEQLALAEVPAGGLSVLDKAKQHAVDAAARRVNALARAAVPEIIELLTPAFDRHAERYIDAVRKLSPGVPLGLDNASQIDLNAENLVAWGSDAVAAYGDARQEAQHLNQFSLWVFETSHLTGVIPKDAEVVLRVLRPSTVRELIALDEANTKNSDPTLLALNPVFFTAARLGVGFGMNTLQEAAGIRARLEAVAASSVQFT